VVVGLLWWWWWWWLWFSCGCCWLIKCRGVM
jgi:hypothetical protein